MRSCLRIGGWEVGLRMAMGDLEHFVAALYESGVLSAAEIQAFFDSLAEEECPTHAEDLAGLMVGRGMLTPFQARALIDGKGRGLVLGSYVILDRLGKGGMGRLFRCMHRQMKRVVALKVLSPSLMKSQQSIERFQREVEAMARLSHPNIVTAFDAGEDKGLRFLAMEYVDGKNLGSLIADRGPLPVSTAADYVLQAAQGLEYAHWHGMVHRDVKPENLILDWRGIVKVLDMGIVGLVAGLSEPGNGDALESVERRVAYGTPDYMAPEQTTDSAPLGPACDIYSLGCTLHYLLTGRPVFEGDTAEAKVMAHQCRPIPSLRAARADVPPVLDRLFQRMLAKRPEDRPTTMGDVIAELQRCLALLPAADSDTDRRDSILRDHATTDVHEAATLPVPLTGRDAPPSTESRRARFAGPRRRRAFLWAGSGMAGVFLAGIALGSWWRNSGRGCLVVDIQGPQVTVQVLDGDGDVVLDWPSAAGRLGVTLPAGFYRLIVRIRDAEHLNEDIHVPAGRSVVIQAPAVGARKASLSSASPHAATALPAHAR